MPILASILLACWFSRVVRDILPKQTHHCQAGKTPVLRSQGQILYTVGPDPTPGDGIPETGDRRPETENRRRKTGDGSDGRQEMGDRRQEKGDRRPEIRDGRWETGDRILEMGEGFLT